MQTLLAIVIGVFYAAGLYMLLRRSIVKLLIGLVLLGHAANLLVFTMGNLSRETPPIVETGQSQLTGFFSDPLPQALVLTAIVIGFGVQAFAIVLVKRTYHTVGSDDLDEIFG